MTDIKDGDKVRVTVEGIAHFDKLKRGFTVGNSRTFIDHNTYAVVEILEPAKPKVGDVIPGADVRAHKWKVGTIIRPVSPTDNGHPGHVLNGYGKWYSLFTGESYRSEGLGGHNSYEVVYLP